MPAAQLGQIDGVGILGAGTAFPPLTLDNLDVLRGIPLAAFGERAVQTGRRPEEEQLRFLAEGVRENLGLWRRSWAHRPGEPLRHGEEPTTLELATQAARRALADAALGPERIGLVLCATSTPHRMTSTLSAPLGSALGMTAACMDVRTGCSAGLFALSTAALFVQAGAAGDGAALVVAAETFSKIIPPQSRLAQLSLADGAGALVVGRKPGAALLGAFLQSDGALGRLINTDGALPPTEAEIARGGYQLSGAPDELTAAVPGKYETALAGALTSAGLGAADVDLYVPHQTSAPVIAEVCKRVGIPPERAFVNVGEHANVGSAGWIVALAEARARGLCKDGSRVALAAVGGGMSWAAAVLRW
jgi:3-oxoacyl-(acyl-carrier-protein) synthase III